MTSSPPSPAATAVVSLAALAETWLRRPPVVVVLLAALLVYGVITSRGKMGDYEVYQRAADRLVRGEPIYRLDDPHRYLYAPLYPLLFLPFASLPPFPGRFAWFAVNVCLAAAAFRMSRSLAFPDGRAPPGFGLLLLLFSLRFLDNNVAHGQTNLWILWLVLAAYSLADRGRFALAGLALAAAILTKVFPAVLLLQLALRRQWRFMIATIAGAVVLLAAPGLWWRSEYGAVLGSWLAVVIDQTTHYDMGNKINQSISAFPHRLFRPYPDGAPWVVLPGEMVRLLALGIHAAFVAALAGLSTRLARAGAREPAGPGGEELSLWLLYATIASPYSWKYYFVQLLLPFAVALRRLWEGPRSAASALAAVFLLNVLPGQRVFGRAAGLLFQQYSFHFLAAVAVFVLIRATTRLASAPAADPPSQAPTTSVTG